MMKDVCSTTDMLTQLISFDTTSSKSNKPMIDFIIEFLNRYNITCNIGSNHEGTKGDLIATIGPMVKGGIVLSGHTDVVPVDGQDWDTNPFKLIKKNKLLFGRGTSDMKGFIAVVLSLVPEILALNLKIPLHLAFSYDEEIGCLGAPGLIARLIKDLPMPMGAIIGEPTGMKLVNAHKGGSLFETEVTGYPGHASQTQAGVNAISVAAECIVFLNSKAKAFTIDGTRDERMEPPYNTINIGVIDGGTAGNIIAGSCRFTWGCRSIINRDVDELIKQFSDHCNNKLLPSLVEISRDVKITTKKISSVPPLMQVEENPVEAVLRQLTGQNQMMGVAFGTEAGLFSEAGIPSVVYGPGYIDQAHKPNEYISIAQLEECSEFIRKLAGWASK
jgi:acetylornithine deacetylase